MKVAFSAFLFLAISTTANAGIFDKRSQDCMVNQILAQYPMYKGLQPRYAGAWALDVNNWDAIILTTLSDGGFDRFFVSLKNGDYKNAILQEVGLTGRRLDLSACF